MHYGMNGRPHALDSIDGVPINFPTANLSVTYTDFGKIKTLTEGNKSYELVYGVDNERRQSIYRVNGVVQMTKYYLGDYEEEVTPDGNIRKIHYISGDDGLSAILIRNHGSDTLYYCYTDQLGSLTALTDMYGNVVERFAYDPWGKRRNPENWAQSDSRPGHIVTRGYTMHEHIDAFNIINMNGRVYDPLTAQFFSPDPYIAISDDWRSYNRYAYCLDNPFNFVDPSGENPVLIALIAGLIEGGINLASNWDKIDNVQDAVGYFASGFAGGLVATIPGGVALGGTITSIGNIITDVAGGDLPEFKNAGDFVSYFGGKILDGIGAAGVGSLTKSVYNSATLYFQRVYSEGTKAIIRKSQGSFLIKEVVVEGGKTNITSSIGKVAAKQGSNYLDDAATITRRVGRDGNAVEVILKNGNKIDINAARVKEWVPNLHPNAPAETLQKVKFENFLPGSKGYKRLPTKQYIDFLFSLF